MKPRMKTTRPSPAPPGRFLARIQQLTREIERLVEDLRRTPPGEGDPPIRGLLGPAAKSLEQAARAVRTIIDEGKGTDYYGDLRAILQGTSPLMSQLGSRVVLARVEAGAPSKPSTGAQALAVLLEDPARAVGATEIAERLGCSVPIARTTLNRLVESGHAARAGRGRFRARES
jgi:hypothetical protein